MNLFREKPVYNGHQFINYLGLPGAGKTLSMVEEQILPAYLNGQQILSNFWLNLKGVKYFYTEEDFLDFRNGVLAFDEIGQILDPYNWKNLSFNVRRYFQNHRKFHVDIFSTTQDISFIAKPARVLISEYVFSENSTSNFLNSLLSLFGSSDLSFKQRHLTFAELYLLQKGLGGSSLVAEDDEFSHENYSEDLSFSDIEQNKDIPIKRVHYSFKKLIHRELDQHKIELVHYYCPVCRSRQLDRVLAEDTDKHFIKDKKGYSILKPIYCPAHPAQLLEARESGVYDTDYLVEPAIPEDIEFLPYVPSPKGYTKIRYKGYVPKSFRPNS